MGYREVYDGWQADPEGFWMQAAAAIDWIAPPSRALDDSRAPLYGWFADAVCNTCWNARRPPRRGRARRRGRRSSTTRR